MYKIVEKSLLNLFYKSMISISALVCPLLSAIKLYTEEVQFFRSNSGQFKL